MGKHYKHLTWRERLRIETRLKDGWNPQKIADEIGRHVSTIYREIKRGLGVQRTTDLVDYECYIPEIAREKYEATFSGKGPDLKIGKDHKLANYLGEVLKDGYRSPEAALGEIAVKGMEFDTKISPRTLYRYIEMGIIPGISSADLPIKRNQGKKKEKQKPRAARNCRGKSIEERPREINAREEVGHWEMDTVESAKDGSLERVLALTGRVTRNQINIKIKTGEAKMVVAALDRLERKLGALFPVVFRSITVDNGSEFADVEGMERSCLRPGEKRTTVYYCHPYSSSERGSNEKQNGMTRRRHTKGTDFKKVSRKKLRETTEWINNYPRKMFGFHTAAELFAAAFPGLPALC